MTKTEARIIRALIENGEYAAQPKEFSAVDELEKKGLISWSTDTNGYMRIVKIA